jgi:hypothetical protein
MIVTQIRHSQLSKEVRREFISRPRSALKSEIFCQNTSVLIKFVHNLIIGAFVKSQNFKLLLFFSRAVKLARWRHKSDKLRITGKIMVHQWQEKASNQKRHPLKYSNVYNSTVSVAAN